MAVNFSDNFKTGAPKPTDDRYFDWTNSLVPWASTTVVNSTIPANRRHVGLTVNINGEEYWYKDGILDVDLVLKDQSGDASATYNNVWMSGVTETGLNLKTWYDTVESAGRISGGTITAGVGASVNVAAGTGLIKDGTGDTAQNRYVTWGAQTVNISTGYNYVYYDAIDGEVKSTTSEALIERNDNFNLGRVYYDGTLNLAVIRLCGQNLWNLNRRIHLYGDQVYGVQRASGLVTTTSGGLTFQVSAGVLWAEVLNRFTTTGFDSTTDDFREWQKIGANWAAPVITDGDLDNEYYNQGSTSVTSLSTDYYTIRWVYVVHDSSIHVVYDTNQYSGLTQAQLASPPAVIPPMLQGYATLSARVIVQEGNPNIVEVDSAYEQVFVTQSVATHNDLGGIQGGGAGEYYHLTNAQIAEVENIDEKLDIVDFNSFTGTTLPANYYNKTQINSFTGTTLPTNYYNKTQINTFTGTTLPTNYYNKTEIDSYTGDTDTRIEDLEIISANAVTGATNGLGKTGRNVCLGGALANNTTINLDSGELNFSTGTVLNKFSYLGTSIGFNGSCLLLTNSGNDFQLNHRNGRCVVFGMDGLHNGNDYSANYTARSLVDAAWVTGKTSTSGVQTANNGLTKVGTNVKLGGTLSETTTLLGSQTLNFNVTQLNATGSTGIDLTGEVRLKTTPNDYIGAVLTFDPSDGSISKTTLSSLGGLTGATNGLSKVGQDVELGGTLSKDTSVLGDDFNLSLGTDASKLDVLEVNTSGNIDIASDKNLVLSVSGGTITTSDSRGLRYTSDYSTTFQDSSLVSKLYVDTVAVGLDPKSAVLVTTTGNITLSNTQTIDGVPVVVGDRVLVKNQTDGTENGVYDVAAGAWIRSSDFDDSPDGEVTEGALVPVLSGNTGINSSWILITKNPITLDTTPLVFTKFSQLLDVSAGDGVRIDTVGQTKEINVELASNSGLEFSGGDLKIDLADNSGLQLLSTGLTVNSAIAGNALDWTNGVIDVNISDINTALGGVLSATTNGLSETTTGIVELGGALTKPTTLTLSSDSDSLTFIDTAATPVGIVYSGDYYDTFVDNSLVSKKYVTSQVSGITANAITTANNGLTKVGQNVVLGGELTGDTTISGISTASLYVSGISVFGVESSYFELCTTTNGSHLISNMGGGGQGTELANCGTGLFLRNQSLADATTLLIYNGGTTFTDETSNTPGIQYGADYSSGFTSRSLVDREYVDTTIATSAVTAGLGLIKNGNAFDARITDDAATGYELNVKIDSSGFNVLYIDSADITNDYLVAGRTAPIVGTELCLNTNTGNTLVLDSAIITNDCFVSHAGYIQYGNQIHLSVDNSTNYLYVDSASITQDNLVAAGGQYNGGDGICLKYIPSICQLVVDPADIQAEMTGNTFSNGLTETSGAVVLGGALTDDVIISSTNNHYLNFEDLGSFKLTAGNGVDTTFSLTALQTPANTGFVVSNQNTVALTSICLDGSLKLSEGLTSLDLSSTSGTIFTDGLGVGIQYAIDYSGNYTDRSLVDAAYVTGFTSQGIVTADNGLIKVGQNVSLGGNLTGTTTIDIDSNQFNLYQSGNAFGLRISADGSPIIGDVQASNAHIVVGATDNTITSCVSASNYIKLSGSSIHIVEQTSSVKLDGSTIRLSNEGAYVQVGNASNIDISGATNLLTTPTAGSASDDVLVRDSGTGEIKTVSGAALGDHNNIYAMEVITGDITLTTGSTYVQLVSGSSITVTLPASPIDGQVFRIKDAAGTAMTNPITISGGGNDIDKSNTPALLNTDGGALELVWNAQLNSWYVFSFVN